METAPLKSFATWARAALIREITARVAVVLGPASPERIEHPGTVAVLEKAVTEAGGDEKGRAAVSDRVAYTWFNRIIALRFMDANGYTGVGVVSPQAGIENGQPEILADAKRGFIDGGVVSAETSRTITDLLTGARRSNDPQGEAYALLLAEYCRHWNRAMPFMFERQGAYTELLIPSNLLAEGSVLSRAVKVLTPEVGQDVEVIGWLYQFYISERKDEVFAGFKKNQKAGATEIPAATQLFTPHWIVRYLVENSLGRLWMLNRPSSRMVDQMKYYVAPVHERTNFLKISSPEELTIIDPACGSGHMLTYAFDLLYAIYEEEGYARSEIPGLILANNLYGTEIDPRAGALAAFALTMKARARQRTFLNKQVKVNICVIKLITFTVDELRLLMTRDGDRIAETEFWTQFEQAGSYGALIRPDAGLVVRLADIPERELAGQPDLLAESVRERARRVVRQAEILAQRYDVLVANPPYMGSTNMESRLASFVEREFGEGKGDLMTAFMLRAQQFVRENGHWGMINIPTWMFLSAYRRLRVGILAHSSISSMLHLGRGVFGADFGSVAFVIDRTEPAPRTRGVYRKLFDEHVEIRSNAQIELLFEKLDYNHFVVEQADLRRLPGSQIAYWAQSATLQAFSGEHLTSHATPRIGIQSGDNERHYRYWFEVSAGDIRLDITALGDTRRRHPAWVPLQRGGDRRRWYGNVDSVVNLSDAGAAILHTKNASLRNVDSYFQECVAWNRLSNGRFYPRFVDPGTAFDDLSPFVTVGAGTSVTYVLGLLASKAARHFLGLFNQGRKTEVGHVAALPWPSGYVAVAAAESRILRLVELARTDWNWAETSLDFVGIGVTAGPARSVQRWVESLETEMDGALDETLRLERANDETFIAAYGLTDELEAGLPVEEVTLLGNPAFRYGGLTNAQDGEDQRRLGLVKDLLSYFVGCLFGRYSLDEAGLVVADQDATLQDYLARVPKPTFMPDDDNVIPIVNGDWFEDDIVARFRDFLRIAFGEEHFEENLRFVTESLSVKDLRSYFLKSFYDDHVKRYKKRPIYWLFSSPKGSFSALIYLHRYTPSTVSTVLNEYLREYSAKLAASLQQQERLVADGGTPQQVAFAQKEADRLRKVLVELEEYEHNVLYPLASRQLAIDLDDGVKANYPKFGTALKRIPGLEASDE